VAVTALSDRGVVFATHRTSQKGARWRPYAGYPLAPDVVEFWCASPDRLHRRLRYDRQTGSAGEWRAERLQP
jgi:pyridoxine/pyridoxamine 5'-phosphate oxidase